MIVVGLNIISVNFDSICYLFRFNPNIKNQYPLKMKKITSTKKFRI